MSTLGFAPAVWVGASTAPTPSFSEFAVPTLGANPWGLTAGPDGNLWFTELGANNLGTITPLGKIGETPYAPNCCTTGGYDVVTGPDGNLWFTNTYFVGKMTSGGITQEYSTFGAYSMTVGADGNLWYTASQSCATECDVIGRVTPQGAVTQFTLPASCSCPHSGPLDLVGGPDGNVWFTEEFNHAIGRITPAGVITEFALPATEDPYAITDGPDGSLWFTAFPTVGGQNSVVGRITTTGAVAQFPTTTDGLLAGITTGPDGNLWVTEHDANAIGQMTLSGAFTQFALPTTGATAAPEDIVSGPDGNLWFTDVGAIGGVGHIWRMILNPASLAIDASSLHDGVFGQPYSVQLSAIGGAGPYTFAITSGSLPNGLTMSTSGLISGTPTTSGTYDFVVSLTDSSVPSLLSSLDLALTIASAQLPTTLLPPVGLHVDDLILSDQPLAAFVDTSNPSGLVGTNYTASVSYFVGDSSRPAFVSSASTTGLACPAALNDPSNFDCFLIFPSNDFAYPRTGTYTLSVFVESTAGGIGLQATTVGVTAAHYVVQIRAWIPFPIVVDPLNLVGKSPAGVALNLGWPTCAMPSGLADHLRLIPSATVTSYLLGDIHTLFDGSFRVETTATFDWDGMSILNFDPKKTSSFSHRSITYTIGTKSYSCLMSGQATAGTTSRLLAPTSFGLDYSSSTPLVPLAPTIDASLQGTFEPDGTIVFGFITDGFPSHGVEITRDGVIQQVDLLNDVSCISQADVLGLVGFQNVDKGLLGDVNSTGSFTDSPSLAGTGGFSQHSGLC